MGSAKSLSDSLSYVLLGSASKKSKSLASKIHVKNGELEFALVPSW